eukprot:9012375-Pyramimonas_sp.AAC.1
MIASRQPPEQRSTPSLITQASRRRVALYGIVGHAKGAAGASAVCVASAASAEDAVPVVAALLLPSSTSTVVLVVAGGEASCEAMSFAEAAEVAVVVTCALVATVHNSTATKTMCKNVGRPSGSHMMMILVY